MVRCVGPGSLIWGIPVQVFVYGKAYIDGHVAAALRALRRGGLLWFFYPKMNSAIESNITRETGWETLHTAGFRDIAQVPIGDM